MLQFEKRINDIKTTDYMNPEDAIPELYALIDELHAEYQKVWAQECNTAGAMEILREQMAGPTPRVQQDSFDDPNNKD